MNTCKLYFPSVDNNGSPLDASISNPIYKDIIRSISSVAGGCTVYPVSGYYVNANNQLIQDDISLITAVSTQLEEINKVIHESAMIILKSLNQESVMIEVNNSMEFITLSD